MIQRVQLHSIDQAPPGSSCAHLTLGALSDVARRIRRETRIAAEVS